MAKQSVLRQMIDEGASIVPAFFLAGQRDGNGQAASSERLGSAGTGRKGSVSLVGYNPQSPEQKLKALLRLLATPGKDGISLSDKGSLELLRKEVYSAENKDLDLDGLVKKLRADGVLKPEVKAPALKPQHPRPLFGLAALAPSF